MLPELWTLPLDAIGAECQALGTTSNRFACLGDSAERSVPERKSFVSGSYRTVVQ